MAERPERPSRGPGKFNLNAIGALIRSQQAADVGRGRGRGVGAARKELAGDASPSRPSTTVNSAPQEASSDVPVPSNQGRGQRRGRGRGFDVAPRQQRGPAKRDKGRFLQTEERGPLVFTGEEESPNVLDQNKKVTVVAILGAFKPDVLLDSCVKVQLPAFEESIPQISPFLSEHTAPDSACQVYKNELECFYDEDRRIVYTCFTSFRNALALPSARPLVHADPYSSIRFQEDNDALMLLLLLLSSHVVLLRSTSPRFDTRIIRLLRAARAARAPLSHAASSSDRPAPAASARGPSGEPAAGPLRPLATPLLGFVFPSIPGQEDAQPVSKALEKALDAQVSACAWARVCAGAQQASESLAESEDRRCAITMPGPG